VRITEAAQRLGTSARMLRYRDLLGLLPPVREPRPGSRAATPTQPPVRAGRAAAGGGTRAAAGGGTRAAAGGGTRAAAGGGTRPAAARHRRFTEDDLAAVALALGIEQRNDISPAALSFGLRVLTEPAVRADVAELGRRVGRIPPLPVRALEFEKERALRLLSLAPAGRAGISPRDPGSGRPGGISPPGPGPGRAGGDQSGGRRAARIAGSVVSARDDSYRSGSR
jgi:MerR family transcriptional regulator, copper efflux regulator